MGKHPRRRQKKLSGKLLAIRKHLGLSQSEMLRLLEAEEELSRTNISNYELGQREPPLFILLRYARLAKVSTDLLIDDALQLPAKLLDRNK
jgi:transcriptional regulator with XRE-family HTH domain